VSWQNALQSGFKDPRALLRYLELDEGLASTDADADFKTRVPLSFAKRMEKGNRDCPLLRQVLPIQEESLEAADYLTDPLQEKKKNPIPGLLHKYHGRVLVMLAVSCAVNCRYCFRRHFPYDENQIGSRDWQPVFDYLLAHPDVHEVILSGGDPMMLSNAHLSRFIEAIETISSVKTLRIHTRLPVVIPDRIDEGFLKLLDKTRLKKVMVLHINHVNELCRALSLSVEALRDKKVQVLNQSVLLKGVNDDASSLIALSHGLFETGIMPYYLHLLDKVQGAKHFEVDEKKIAILYEEMQKALPGYLVPKLVSESPDVAYKVNYSHEF
jgi:EF-P beta-lysylation protein EpmB